MKNNALKLKKLKELEEQYNSCKKCPLLVENRTQVVFGTGNPKTCKVMIIGEAPGKNEDLTKQPFVGRSGKILDSLLEEIGLFRPNDVYITNTILCRPPKNRNPSKEELDHCEERLKKHIAYLNPKVIVTLGNFATKYILKTKEGITNIRGKIYYKEIENKKIAVIPMLHPAVLLYNGNSPKKRAEFLKDFKTLQKLIGKNQCKKNHKKICTSSKFKKSKTTFFKK